MKNRDGAKLVLGGKMRVLCFMLVMMSAALASAQPQGPDTLWTREYPELYPFYPFAAISTPDGGFAWAGGFFPDNPDSFDGGLVKMDSSGIVQWVRRFGSPRASEHVFDGIRTRDGGFFLAGDDSEIDSGLVGSLVVKYDSVGDSAWSRPFQIEGDSPHIVAAIEAQDGNLVLGGTLEGMPVFVWLTPDGQFIRYRSYMPWGPWPTWVRGITETAAGNIAMVGEFQDLGSGSLHLYACCIYANANGDTLWTRKYNYPPGIDRTAFYSVLPVDENNLIVSGAWEEVSNHSHYGLFKISERGDTLWTRACDIPNFYTGFDPLSHMEGDSHGGFVVATSAVSGISGIEYGLLFKVDRVGTMQWNWLYGRYGEDNFSRSVCLAHDGGLIWVLENPPFCRVVRLRSDTSPVSPKSQWSFAKDFQLSDIYPNPFNSTTTIALEVPLGVDKVELVTYNVLGQMVRSQEKAVRVGTMRFVYDAGDLATGIYLLRATAGRFSSTQKIMVLK